MWYKIIEQVCMYKYLHYFHRYLILAMTSLGSHRPYNGRAQVKFWLLTFALYLYTIWIQVDSRLKSEGIFWNCRPFHYSSDCQFTGLINFIIIHIHSWNFSHPCDCFFKIDAKFMNTTTYFPKIMLNNGGIWYFLRFHLLDWNLR